MSFTPNIVNIHRSILHVLALRLGWGGGGENLVYFTRTPQKREEGRARRKEKKRWWRRSVKLLFKLVRLFSVWLKAQF